MIDDKFSEQYQISTYQKSVALGGKVRINIVPGIYQIDGSHVKVNFQSSALAATQLHAIRKEGFFMFQGYCQVKHDGKIKATYQNLMKAQHAFYFSQPEFFQEVDYRTFGINSSGKDLPPCNYQILALGDTGVKNLSFSIPLRHFLPFLFKRNAKFFRVQKALEVTITYTDQNDTLLDITKADGAQNALSIQNDEAISVQFLMDRTLSKDEEIMPLCYIQQDNQSDNNINQVMEVEFPDKQISKYQHVYITNTDEFPNTLGILIAANFTSCNIKLNKENLVLGDTYADAYNQISSYQLEITGAFLLPLYNNPGTSFDWSIKHSTTANNSNICILMQYEDI